MKRMRKSSGFTLVELLVVVLIIALLIGILMPSLAKAREAAKRMECSSQMRQIGLAIFQFEKQYGYMPNAQWNAFQELGEFLGFPPGGMGANAQDAETTKVARCPSDEFLPQASIWDALSYAPIVDSGYLGPQESTLPAGGTGTRFIGNTQLCAWSTCRMGYQSDIPNVGANKSWAYRNLAQIAPDTFLLCEYWSPANRLRAALAKTVAETPAGYLLYSWTSDAGNDNTKMGLGGTIKYPGCGALKQRCSPVIDSVDLATGTNAPNQGGIGGYIMLSAFGHRAAQNGKAVEITSILHGGSMNVLTSDGAVQQKRLKEITDRAPYLVGGWTRTAD